MQKCNVYLVFKLVKMIYLTSITIIIFIDNVLTQ